jgi:signal transduction histidine kinase
MAPLRPLILVVDDHDAGRFAKAHMVRRAGYRVIEAANGRDAIRMANEQAPDLILLDVNLPDISGLDVCRVLKESGSAPPVQVLQLSSTAISDGDRVRGLEGGADAYLTEPVNAEIVLATIEALLRVRAAELRLAESVALERKAREEAERANRFKDQFLATLSHELRTPLNAMTGWIWQLRQGRPDEATYNRALDALERSTATQLRLINDLLDISRIDRGKIELQRTVVDLETVVRASADGVERQAQARGVTFDVSTEPAHVNGDPARLSQVVTNLLTNAIQFSERGSSVSVSLRVEGTEAVIRVIDQGQGIIPELLPHVFDAFRQGEGGFARHHGGLGLGLAIVRQLVMLHHGTVTAASEGKGKGATFTVRVPLGTQQDESTDAGARTGPITLEGLRVLVVDDEEDSRAWIRSLVETAGGTADVASSAAEALAAMAIRQYDLLLSDIGMPHRDGLDLLHDARRRGWSIPAIAVTAFASNDDTRRILAAGYYDVVTKPVDADLFLQAVENALPASRRTAR